MQEALRALRIKGRATAAELAAVVDTATPDVEAQLRALTDDGLAVERTSGRRPGWLLTAAGRARAEEQLTQDDSVREALAGPYAAFLRCNDQVKEICTSWQSATGEEQRFEVLDRLHEVHEQVAPSLDKAGATVERFRRYRSRLDAALERVPGDPRYVVSPAVDSYHTVWFECHEDFLLSLGRSRAEEGSW